jgi:hypothetical protein
MQRFYRAYRGFSPLAGAIEDAAQRCGVEDLLLFLIGDEAE